MENKNVSPPPSNTGVPNTFNEKQSLSLDWLAGTFFNLLPKELIQTIKIPESKFVEVNGFFGYRKCLTFNTIKILFDGTDEMGIHLILPSAALAYLDERSNIFNLFLKFTKLGFEVSRIDLALDVFDNLMPTIIRDIKDHNYRTKSRTIEKIDKIDTRTNKIIGQTLYIGSRSSEKMLRIYNKQQESKLDYKLTRFELELKGDKAKQTFEILISGKAQFSDLTKQMLRDHIKFIRPTNDSNKSRWPLAIYWAKITSTDKKLDLAMPKKPKSLDATIQWLLKSVSKSLLKADIATGENGLLQALLNSGLAKITDEEIQEAEDYFKRIMKG